MEPMEPRKYILGYVMVAPENRAKLVDLARDYAKGGREEPGCLFFEFVPHHERPDTLMLMECFVSEAAHLEHQETEHFKAFMPQLREVVTGAAVEQVYSDKITTD